MDVVIFHIIGHTEICLEEVLQMAVPVGHQDNYGVWSSSSECSIGGEVCSLWLTCLYCVLQCSESDSFVLHADCKSDCSFKLHMLTYSLPIANHADQK